MHLSALLSYISILELLTITREVHGEHEMLLSVGTTPVAFKLLDEKSLINCTTSESFQLK